MRWNNYYQVEKFAVLVCFQFDDPWAGRSNWSRDPPVDRKFCIDQETICTSLGQKGENRPPEPNNGVWVPKVWDYKILRYFRKLPKKIESWWISRKYSI
jgi:hypothetical protein